MYYDEHDDFDELHEHLIHDLIERHDLIEQQFIINIMYQALKNNTVQYILDYEPTPEQLEALGCDSYEVYEEPAETPEQQKARVKQALISTPDLSSVDLE